HAGEAEAFIHVDDVDAPDDLADRVALRDDEAPNMRGIVALAFGAEQGGMGHDLSSVGTFGSAGASVLVIPRAVRATFCMSCSSASSASFVERSDSGGMTMTS